MRRGRVIFHEKRKMWKKSAADFYKRLKKEDVCDIMIPKMSGPCFERYFALIGEKSEKFSRFGELLLSYNEKFNLTALTQEREILIKHYLDSLAGEALIPQNSTVAEIGSGAGFPSLPIAVAREDLSFTLIESTGKKCEFLKTAVRELGLGKAEVLHMRAEEGARTPLRETFDVCIARAVAPLNTLLEYCLPYVRTGGLFLAWKGSEDELKGCTRALALLGGKTERVLKFSLPEGYGERAILAFRKLKETPAKYPRGNGKERRDPL